MQHNLVSKPRFRRLHRSTGAADLSTTIGRLVLVWWMADQHSIEGRMFGSFDDVDDACGCPGFADAMESVDWLAKDGDDIIFIGFGDHNGKTAKARMIDQKRTRDKRRLESAKPVVSEIVGHLSESCPSLQDHSTEHNRTVQDKTKSKSGRKPSFDWDSDCPPSLNTKIVRDAFAEWVSYRREQKYKAWAPRTIKTRLRAFESLGGQAFVDAVENSIGNGYQGLFPTNGGGKPKVMHNNQNTMGDQDMLAKLKEQSI